MTAPPTNKAEVIASPKTKNAMTTATSGSIFGDLDNLERHLRIAQQEALVALDPKLEELNAVEV